MPAIFALMAFATGFAVQPPLGRCSSAGPATCGGAGTPFWWALLLMGDLDPPGKRGLYTRFIHKARRHEDGA